MTEDPRAAADLAQQLTSAGRLAEAEAIYVGLLTRFPHLADTWYNLGRVQRLMGKFHAALASYQQALDRNIAQPEEVHLNRGVIYSDGLRQPAMAEREFSDALRLNPLYVPAVFNLANLHEDLGRRDAALSLYERVLTLAPDHYEALARYASIRTPRSADDPAIGRLRAAIASSNTSAADRASLGFALGKALDACGAYDEAFAAYTAANRASRTLSPPNAVLYDRNGTAKKVQDIITAFSGQPPAVATPATPRPTFICGMFRSGSTLTEQILSAHSQVTAGGELSLLPSLIARELTPFPARVAHTADQQLQQLAGRYRSELRQLFPRAVNVTDKRPDNFLNIGLIKRLFPDAKIVHTTRQALDNCLSIYFLHLDHRMGYALDFMDIGHYYAQYRRLMTHWKTLYGEDILDFDYDAFVQDPRASIAQLLQFCDLEWEENCLSFQQAATAVRTASVWQVRQQVYQQSSGRWKNYARHIEPLRQYLLDAKLID